MSHTSLASTDSTDKQESKVPLRNLRISSPPLLLIMMRMSLVISSRIILQDGLLHPLTFCVYRIPFEDVLAMYSVRDFDFREHTFCVCLIFCFIRTHQESERVHQRVLGENRRVGFSDTKDSHFLNVHGARDR